MRNYRFVRNILILSLFLLIECNCDKPSESSSTFERIPESNKLEKVDDDIGIIIEKSGLIMKTDSDMSSKTIIKIPFGKQVKILGKLDKYIKLSSTSTGAWYKIEYLDKIGWLLGSFESLGLTEHASYDLFVVAASGLNIYEFPNEKSIVICKAINGDVLKLSSTGFHADKENGYNWNFTTINGKIGYFLENNLNTISYSLEEIAKASFIGMNYRGNVPGCKSNSGAILEDSRIPKEKAYSVSLEECKGVKKIFIEKQIKYIGRSSVSEIVEIIDIKESLKSKGDQFAVLDFAEYVCVKGDSFIPVAIINLEKHRKPEDKNETNYRNVIKVSWEYNSNSGSIKKNRFEPGILL